MQHKIVFEFEDKELLDTFFGWYLDGGGEQNAWDGFECEGIHDAKTHFVDADGEKKVIWERSK